jgi:DNA-binding CsgD family transcriptional regulator
MKPTRMTPGQWEEAKRECTAAQIAALELWNIGFGYKRISLVLGIDPSSAKARIRAGLAKLGLEIELFRAA